MKSLNRGGRLITTKNLAVTMGIVLIVSLIPLLVVAKYDIPSADDYYNAFSGYSNWNENHSLAMLAQDAAENTKMLYDTWQGTFSSIFLLNMLYPFVIDNYWSTAYLIILPLCVCSIFLMFIIFRKVFHADFWASLLISIVSSACMLQMVPSAAQSFYWACSAFIYTLFSALFFLLMAMTVLLLYRKDKGYRVFYMILGSVLAVACGGSNAVTSFGGVELFVLLICFLMFLKNKNWKIICVPALFFILSFFIMLVAPGNALRQEAMKVGRPSLQPSAISAIIKSMLYGLGYIRNISPFLWLCVLFLAPFFVKIAKNENVRFRFPVIVSLFSYLYFASLSCPEHYAENAPGTVRVLGVYSCFFIILFVLNVFYWIGWLTQRISKLCQSGSSHDILIRTKGISVDIGDGNLVQPKGIVIQMKEPVAEAFLSFCRKHAFVGLCVVVILFAAFASSSYSNGSIWYYSSVSAAKDLNTGAARQYYSEYQERLKLYNDPEIKDAAVKPFSVVPRTLYLFFTDITEDPLHWINKSVSNFYNKNSVRLESGNAAENIAVDSGEEAPEEDTDAGTEAVIDSDG